MMDFVKSALQRHKAVTAYYPGKQLLPFGFARHNVKARCAISVWLEVNPDVNAIFAIINVIMLLTIN